MATTSTATLRCGVVGVGRMGRHHARLWTQVAGCDLVGVVDGLKAGQSVVSTGVFKLRNGAEVQINNTAQPAASSAPRPPNT